MAAQLYFARDSKLFVEFDFKLWEVPVLDGFSFSQTTNSSDITLQEMQNADGISRRGRRMFTDSLAPAEFSFSSYVRPYYNSTSTEHHSVEEVLWALMAGADQFGTTAEGGAVLTADTIAGSGTSMTAGTYTIDESDFTLSDGAGVGAVFSIVVSTTAITSVTVLSGGSNYDVDDTFSIAESVFGGSGSNSFTFDVATVDDSSASGFLRGTNVDSNSPFGATVSQGDANSNTINFGQSNRSVMATCNLYFVMETNTDKPMIYKLEGAALNEASIDFDVDGIATINWSGFASNIEDMQSQGFVYSVSTSQSAPTEAQAFSAGGTAKGSTLKHGEIIYNKTEDGRLYLALASATRATNAAATNVTATGTATNATVSSQAIIKAVDSTTAFIRNRLTQLVVDNNSTTNGLNSTYSMTLTGGNVTISNNITYLVPEELGKVNKPIEHVTGGRTVSGSYTCYLTFNTSSNAGTSSDFYNDLSKEGLGLDLVVNDFRVEFQIGGNVLNAPRLYVSIPKCHIEVPSHSIDDVISVETNFGAYTTDFDKADEFRLTYYGDETNAVA
jgi:hypothetical protein